MSFSEVRLDESFKHKHKPSLEKTIHQFKVIMLGEVAVGKTSLLKRFVDDDFTKEYKCTIGVEFRLKTIDISDTVSAELKIWDTCGAEKYRVITRQYYRDAPGVILVFDLTNKETFDRLDEWLNDIQTYAAENVTILLIGNKSDNKQKREVRLEAIQEFCLRHDNLDYIEASAKSGIKVNSLFSQMAHTLVEKEKKKDLKSLGSFSNNLNSPLANSILSKKMKQITKESSTNCCS